VIRRSAKLLALYLLGVALASGCVSTGDQEGELEDTFTLLAARESGIPERLARPLVRRILRSARMEPATG